MIRHDHSVPADRNVHHWQERNPIVLEGLVQLMLGGPNHVYHGGLLHCRLFYFDPVRTGDPASPQMSPPWLSGLRRTASPCSW